MQQGHNDTPKPAFIQSIQMRIDALQQAAITASGIQTGLHVHYDTQILDILNDITDALEDLYNQSHKERR